VDLCLLQDAGLEKEDVNAIVGELYRVPRSWVIPLWE
jgi:hypothetical protein